MKILVVDDEKVVREHLRRFLSAKGHSVVCGEDGNQALPLATRERPDLVLIDLYMPEVGGAEAIRNLKSDPATRDIPVAVLTGLATPEAVRESRLSGAVDILVKSDMHQGDLASRIHRAALRNGPVHSTGSFRPTPPAGPTAPASPESERKAGDPLTAERIEFRLMEALELKALPFIVAEVVKLTTSQLSDGEILSKTVARDPAVASRVLQLANSAFFAPDARIRTLSQAVARLGFRQVRELTIALKLMEEFSAGARDAGVSVLGFWKHAIATAALARKLAEASGARPEEKEAAFLAGLLQNIGQTFLLDRFPEAYGKIFRATARQGLPIAKVERNVCCVDHGEISRRILSNWKILEDFLDPIAGHHRSSAEIVKTCSPRNRLPGILWLSNILANASRIGTDGDDTLDEVPDELLVALGLEPPALTGILERLDLEVDELTRILLLPGGSPEEARGARLPSFDGWTVALVSETPALIDPVEILLRRQKASVVRLTTLADATSAPQIQAILVRARDGDWLAVQLEGAIRAGGGRCPLAVCTEKPFPRELKNLLRTLRGQAFRNVVSVPRLLAVLKGKK
jgi:HD-like signal output (HDOD) protein/DNA-binding NarL/FixJ family response regulator